MINHLVLFKLKNYPIEQKQPIIAEMKSLLEGLNGKIDELKYIEVGANYELETKNYDLVLITHFDTIEDLDLYRVHSERQKSDCPFCRF